MPWKDLNVVKIRAEFVLKSLDKNVVFRDLCREYGVSTKTGYKWRERFLSEGVIGLNDQSRRPKAHPDELPERVACEIIRLKTAHMKWGPKKIRELYRRRHGDVPSESSFKRVLSRAGLVKPRKRRRQRAERTPRQSTAATKPNDIWTVDFKGWWCVSRHQRCEPLTIRDDFSRYVLALRAMDTSRTKAVRSEFERAFESYGVPDVIRSDNGSPFAASHAPLGLSKLSAWWIALGIDLDRIDPGRPDQNGGHERMHLDIRKDLQGSIRGDLADHQHAFDLWREEFNWERPHEALKMKMPGEIYQKSSRAYEGTPEQIEYPLCCLQRKVSQAGMITINSWKCFLSASLAGWTVGLKPIGGDRLEIWFDHLRLGEIDLSSEAVIWADQPRLQSQRAT